MAKNSKSAANDAPAEPKEGAKDLIVTLKSAALSTEVGPMVLASLSKAQADEAAANALLNEVGAKRYDALASMTMAIVKAAKADDTIDLTVAFKSDDKPGTNLLMKQIRLAMGIDEIVTVGTGAKQIKKQQTAKTCAKYFPLPGEDKDAQETKRKATFRSNFAHQVKKAVQAASGIIEKGIIAKVDKASGTLAISGPAVMEAFGKESVVLDEKQGAGDDKLKIKPSFTAVANIGAAAQGKIIQQRAQTGNNPVAVDAETAIVSQCTEVVKTVNKIGEVTPAMRKAFESLVNAITKKLEIKKAA